nr:hypothetical protein [Tanacetum cinerariifolium]
MFAICLLNYSHKRNHDRKSTPHCKCLLFAAARCIKLASKILKLCKFTVEGDVGDITTIVRNDSTTDQGISMNNKVIQVLILKVAMTLK